MSVVHPWLNVRPSRGVAFAIHLILSVLVFSTLVAMMLVYWFPGDLFIMDGGWEGLKLVAMVDLVLGPALTLILFKPGKPGLKFDLAVIATVQIAALAYGFHTTYNQRTVAVVFAENEFATVSAKDNKEADKTLVELDLTPKALPPTEAFQIPLLVSPLEGNFGAYLAEMLNGLPSAHERSDRYVDLTGQHEAMKPHQKTVASLEGSEELSQIEQAVSKHKRTLDDVEIYRFRARYASGYAIYDPSTSRIIDYVKQAKGGADTKSTVAENAE